VIVVCGIASESPVARFTAAPDGLGLPYAILHQRRFRELLLELEVTGTGLRGRAGGGRPSVDDSYDEAGADAVTAPAPALSW
jgi:hypothetical protein